MPTNSIQGVRLLIAGLFLKLGVADVLAAEIDHAWSEVGALETNRAWLIVYGYAAQLLADFGGYSTMAVRIGAVVRGGAACQFSPPLWR